MDSLDSADHERMAANLANWSDRVAIHMQADGYDPDTFASTPEALSGTVMQDRKEVGSVEGLDLLHLQCHIGTDTLSWARLGARVTGIDFSEEAIVAARSIANQAGLLARFLVSDLYESPNVLAEQFDIVVTGTGSINWMPDIRRWAKVVAGFVRPGGTFYIRDGHPMLRSIDVEPEDRLEVSLPYFEGEPSRWDEPGTYLGEGAVEHTTMYEWNQGLGEIVTAIIDAGLVIEFVHEHQTLDWQGHPLMERMPDGMYAFPNPQICPATFSVRAHRPTVDVSSIRYVHN